MAEFFNPDKKLTSEELATHLRQPDGEQGKEVGLQMNKGNQHICRNTLKVLSPQDNERILEIGMGNGYFVKELLEMATQLEYTGIDFSATMVEESRTTNQDLVASGYANFIEASIESLPLEDCSIDGICTTNTLYFWPQPLDNAKELLRVLSPGGRVVIGYRDRSCLDQLSMTAYGFSKYEVPDVEQLLKEAGFENIKTEVIKEPEMEFEGKTLLMEGYYTIGHKAR